MRVVAAIDSFKGSLTSMQAGDAAAVGIRRVYPDAVVDVRPIADGGEGTVEALVRGMHGNREKILVCGPLGEQTEAVYGIIPEKNTAIIEMAAAAGLPLVPSSRRNPMHTTTYGVGEIILDALSKGCRNFIIGIGGSATNDGGIGMLQALGFDFLDGDGCAVPYGAAALRELRHISAEHAHPVLSECTFHIACDVKNPLCGENGCSAVYAPQKGADSAMIADMDNWMREYARLTKLLFPHACADEPGAGAAGGMGFAFRAYLGGTLEKGIELILRETELERFVRGADVVITGEGRLDAQTAMGKAPAGVAAIAKKYGKPVLAFCGCVGDGAEKCCDNGIDAYFPIVRGACSIEDAMNPQNASVNLAACAEQVFRLMRISRA